MALPGREWHRLDERIGRVMEDVGVLVPDADLRFVRQFLTAGEQCFGVDNLLRVLIATRAALPADTLDVLGEVVRALDCARPRPDLPYLSDPHGVVELLDVEGRAVRRRGLPPLRGGHVVTARGTCSTCFPAGWTSEAVHAAGRAVQADPELPTTALPNGMGWTASPPGPVGVGVVTTAGGDVAAVIPVRSRRERPRPWYVDPERPTATELLIACVYTVGVGTVPALAGHVTDPQHEALVELAVAGETDLVADVAAALAAQRPHHLNPDERGSITRLLRAFDLPVPGCDHLNDRDAILDRLDPR